MKLRPRKLSPTWHPPTISPAGLVTRTQALAAGVEEPVVKCFFSSLEPGGSQAFQCAAGTAWSKTTRSLGGAVVVAFEVSDTGIGIFRRKSNELSSRLSSSGCRYQPQIRWTGLGPAHPSTCSVLGRCVIPEDFDRYNPVNGSTFTLIICLSASPSLVPFLTKTGGNRDFLFPRKHRPTLQQAFLATLSCHYGTTAGGERIEDDRDYLQPGGNVFAHVGG